MLPHRPERLRELRLRRLHPMLAELRDEQIGDRRELALDGGTHLDRALRHGPLDATIGRWVTSEGCRPVGQAACARRSPSAVPASTSMSPGARGRSGSGISYPTPAERPLGCTARTVTPYRARHSSSRSDCPTQRAGTARTITR